jgi:hypothetical protein
MYRKLTNRQSAITFLFALPGFFGPFTGPLATENRNGCAIVPDRNVNVLDAAGNLHGATTWGDRPAELCTR